MQIDSVDWLVNGLFFGQAMMLTVSAGLLERSWLAGVWRSTLLSFILILVFFGFQDASELITISAVFFFAPIAILCVASPLLALRYFCDWRLVPKQTPSVTRRSISTSDFMLAITSVAALIFMTKVSQVAWEMGTWAFWADALIPMGYLFLLSFITTVPAVWFFFRCKKPLIRYLCSIAWSFLAVTVEMSLISKFDGTSINLGEVLLNAAVGTTVFVSGLTALDFSGFCLNRSAKAIGSSSNSEAATIEQPNRRVELAWVAATLLLAATSSITLAAYEASKNNLE